MPGASVRATAVRPRMQPPVLEQARGTRLTPLIRSGLVIPTLTRVSGFKFTSVLELHSTYGKNGEEQNNAWFIQHRSGLLIPTLLTPAVHFEDK
jgi:hypothetical protein